MVTYPKSTSARPQLVVDTSQQRIVDSNAPAQAPNPPVPPLQGSVGQQAPFGRGKMLTALPTNGSGPVMLSPPVVFGSSLSYLVDPDGFFVGERAAVFVHRLLTARWVEDTRRLGG